MTESQYLQKLLTMADHPKPSEPKLTHQDVQEIIDNQIRQIDGDLHPITPHKPPKGKPFESLRRCINRVFHKLCVK